jgi:Protein of unknown function (DUF1706)
MYNMPKETTMIATISELIRLIDDARLEFDSYLASLTPQQMTDLYDHEGWNVKDHITHLTAWEKTVVMVIQGKPRFQFLGADAAHIATKPIDELNAALREHWKNLPLASALELYRGGHQELIASLQTLTDEDLSRPASQFFPQMADDTRRVLDVIQNNADGHLAEHLPWIKAIVQTN